MRASFVKTLLLFIIYLFSNTLAQAQEYYNPDALKATEDVKKFYIGISSGVESFAGMLGVSLEGNVAKRVSIYGGLGLGGWGYKMSGGIKFYKKYPYKWVYCASVSHATGVKDFSLNLETQTGTKDVKMDLLPCQTINLTVQHHWKLGSGYNRFNIEFGLSLATKNNAYVIKDGSVLTPTSETVMAITQPGGLTAGLGFTFGK